MMKNGGCVEVFLSVEVQKYYKIRDPKEWAKHRFCQEVI